MTVWDYDSDARRRPTLDELEELLANPGVVLAFVVRDIKIRYRRSFLGALWSLGGPLLMMIVLSVAFSHAFAAAAPAFPAFVLPGLLLWNFFAATTSAITAEAASGLELWRRARVPKCATAVATTITGLVHLAIAVIPLIVIEVVFGRPLGLALIVVPAVMLLAALFTLGFALIVASVALHFPDAGHLYQIVLSAWMFLTPVVYPMSILPPKVQNVVAWNPMTIFVGAFRDPLYSADVPSTFTFALMAALAFGTLTLGWFLFTRGTEEAAYRG